MKFYYIVINLFLLVMTSALVYLHVKHRKPKTLKILTQTPTTANKYEKDIYPSLSPPFPIKRNLDLQQGNIFLPNRGYVPKETPKPPEKEMSKKDKENIELVGICKFNNFAAAIIYDKTRGVKHEPFYKVNDTINKFTIKTIESKRVVLTNGVSDFPLLLDRTDKNSKARMKTTYVAPVRRSKHTGPKKTAFQIKQEELVKKRKSRFLRVLKKKK